MIQYSSINDAWGNKEMYKKNNINNINDFINKPVIINEPPKPIDNQKQQETFAQVQQVPVSETIIKPHIETFIQAPKVEQQIPKPEIKNTEHFYDISTSTKSISPCIVAEHLKNCEHCRNSLAEYFESDNNVSTINIFGLKINITKDVLKIIFVIIIVLIFVIILSTINVSLKDPRTNMKYYMVPQMPINNMPFYH
jgi:hypothetical protein